MAKRKLIKLSPKQRAEYNRRLNNLDAIRKLIVQDRASGIRSFLGAGPNTKRELPASIIPREHKKQRFHSQTEYLRELRSLKNYRISPDSYYKVRYKRKIMELWREKISDVSEQINNKGLKPDGKFGKFSSEQIENNKELASYMRTYNDMQSMTTEAFKNAYFSGFIIPFRYMYGELSRYGNIGGGQGYSQTLDRQVDLIKEFKEAGRE